MIKIIDNYRNLPIGKYLEILELSQDENVDALEQQVETISILTGISVEDVLDLPILEYKELAGKTTFLEKEYEGKLQIAKSYGLAGYELIPVKDFTKITTAQYVDFQTFSKEGDKFIVESLSCLLIPKGHKYNDGYDMTAIQQAIRENLSVADVLSLSAFFLTGFVKLIKDFRTFSVAEIKKIPNKELREKLMNRLQEIYSKINGVG